MRKVNVYCLFNLLCIFLFIVAAFCIYEKKNTLLYDAITCQSLYTQHHKDESLKMWLTYNLNNNDGFLSIVGYFESNPQIKINRKILFKLKGSEGGVIFHSIKNLKFPEDSVSDQVLNKYLPRFFVFGNSDISVKIVREGSGNLLFTFSSLPTYVCHINSL